MADAAKVVGRKSEAGRKRSTGQGDDQAVSMLLFLQLAIADAQSVPEAPVMNHP